VIDEWIETGKWPVEVQEAVGQYEQGDLVEQPNFFYVGSAQYGIWRLTREAGDPALADELFELDPQEAPPFGMITTETCDLVEEDGIPRQPWVSVAPVYKLDGLDPNKLSLLNNKRVAYMRVLTAPRFRDGVWVVDVRIEFPIEKSWLVGRDPIQAFQTTGEKLEIARFLSGRRDRPILSKNLYSTLIKQLRRWIERANEQRRERLLAGIVEVRVAVSGDPLNPDGASLIIIGDKEPVHESAKQAWDEKWENWKSTMESVDISLLANEYTTLDQISARKYNESFRIPLEFALS
jgi:hypothetical protein